MIICLECNKEYKRLNIFHLKHHGLTEKSYLEKYPDAKIFSEESLKLISEKTKEAMWSDNTRGKFLKGILKRKKMPENLGKYIQKGRTLTNDEYDKSYSKERNEKISKKKSEWWKSADTNIKRKIMLNMKNNHKIKSEIENLFYNLQIKYISEYEIEGKFFDYFLPNKNILIEIDGEYWHAKNIDYDNMSEIQKRVIVNDRFKNNLAKKYNFLLKRFWVQDVRSGKLEDWIRK